MRSVVSLFIFGFYLCISQPSAADPVAPWPDPATLQSGDLLWPNKPGGFVPYSNGSESHPDKAEQQWLKDRDAFIKSAEHDGASTSQSQLSSLKNMSFAEFYNRYAGDRAPGATVQYANSNAFMFVGHVGIVDIDETGKKWIIDATLDKGVSRRPYSEWLASLSDALIWQGRLRDAPEADRSKIASEARKYLGRPYGFWNFDLDDDKEFYCSKLVWLSIHRALNLAVDGNDVAKREFWFSPKQLLNSPKIAKLHNPANYTRP